METNKIDEIVVQVSNDGWTQSGKNDRECYRIIKSNSYQYQEGTVLNLDRALSEGYTVTIKPKQ